ncbi:MAG: chorismate mutase [Gammaproteobacteria bacterium RBG_16_57_12]|nr:MAG: chorismate mutase [Gammaproteobacteria bacterium RBG_16_57_12]
MSSDQLNSFRECIDQLDEQIQRLINERAACAEQIARIKQAQGEDTVFYRPEREAQILQKIKARNQGPLSGEEMAHLFREIMSSCLALEQPLRVAYLGPQGTYTQAAALKHFGHAVHTVSMATIDEVFREVESGSAHYGVVPVENSTEGVISHTLDTFLSSPLQICGEVELRIHHCLSSGENSLAGINKVFSHQQSLGQCREWLDTHLPRAERIAMSSNAEAARLAASTPSAAAIASLEAAEIYGLGVLAKNIEDRPDNTTRFLVIGRNKVAPSGKDKTSLLFSTRNRPGALYDMLTPLSRQGVNMTRIESRPSQQAMWDYVFFIDIEGHAEDDKVAAALRELEAHAAMFKVLGSYPMAVL